MAQITLEVNDQTAAGFDSISKNLQNTDKSAEVLQSEFDAVSQQVAAATQEVETLRQKLAETEAERVAAIRAIGRENSFLRGAMEETGRAAANSAGSAVGSYVKWKIELFLMKKAAVAAAGSLTGMAAGAAAALAPAITAASVAVGTYKTLNSVLENTNRHFEKLRDGSTIQFSEEMSRVIQEQVGINARNNEELIAQLNAMKNLKDAGYQYADALEKLQKVSEATGKSIEELGVRQASNASKIGDAAKDLGDALAEPYERAGHAISEWWNSSSIVQTTLDKMEGAASWFADGVSEDLRKMRDDWDELRVQVGQVMGANADEYRKEIKNLREIEEAQKRVAQAQERSREHFAALGQVNRELEEEAKREKELARIGKLRSDQINEEITKLQEMAGRAAAAGTFRGKTEKEYTELHKALTRRREEAIKEEAKAAEEAAKKIEEERAKAAKKAAEEFEVLRRAAKEAIEKQAEAMRKTAEEIARGNEELLLQERDQRRELEAERLKMWKNSEQEILELKKESLEERKQLELKFAETEQQRAKINWEFKKQLKDLEHQYAVETEQKKVQAAHEAMEKSVEAARQQFEAEVGLLKNKLLEEKRLKDGSSQSALGKIAGSFSKDQVRDEIVRSRLESGVRSGRNGQGRKLTEAEIRRMVIREMNSGQINQKEVQAAQIDLVKQAAAQGQKTGKLGETTAKGLQEAATAIERQNEELERQAQEIQTISKFIRNGSDASQRRRSQRRSTGG